MGQSAVSQAFYYMKMTEIMLFVILKKKRPDRQL